MTWFLQSTQVPGKDQCLPPSYLEEGMAIGWPSMQIATHNKGNPNAVRTQPKEKQSASLKHVAVGRSKRVCSCSNSQNALSFCIA